MLEGGGEPVQANTEARYTLLVLLQLLWTEEGSEWYVCLKYI